MEGQPVLRLFSCRPRRAAFDRILRDVLIPDLRALGDVSEVFAGRQGPDDLGERLVASVWSSTPEMTAAMGDEVERSIFGPEHLAEMTDRRLEVIRLSVVERFDRSSPVLMRLARGTTGPGELEDYATEVATGVAADVAAGHGPIALYFGTVPPVGFVTMSLWRTWMDVAETTGTSAECPISTRYRDRLETFEAEHFEILPEVQVPTRTHRTADEAGSG